MKIEARIYLEPKDYAGLGFSHCMIAWTDANGRPRSIIWKPKGDGDIEIVHIGDVEDV